MGRPANDSRTDIKTEDRDYFRGLEGSWLEDS